MTPSAPPFAVLPPRGVPAGAARRVLRRARWETLLLARNGEQLLLTVVLPVLILIGLTRTTFIDLGVPEAERIDVVMPGVLALAVLSTAFTAQAISVGFDRRYGVLRHLGAGPLGRTGLILARVLAVCVIVLIQAALLSLVGVLLGWSPRGNPLVVAALLVLGVAAFTGLALALAGTVRAEATLALANLLYVLLLIGGGLFVGVGGTSSTWSSITQWLPTGALAGALHDVLTLGQAPASIDLCVLLGWAALSALIAARWFRWD
jgi:ABC-2 type transport system permease protein